MPSVKNGTAMHASIRPEEHLCSFRNGLSLSKIPMCKRQRRATLTLLPTVA